MNAPDRPLVLLEALTGGVTLLTLDRAATRNALSLGMVEAVHAALQEALISEPGALIITGAGGIFVSGADISELRDRRRADALRRLNTGLFRAIEAFPFPTIAAIEGFALGGGLELAMACDLRVASDTARFGQPEVGLGIIPGAGGTYRLPKLVGLGRARELIFTGDLIDAQEAWRIGLVNRVVPAGSALEAAKALAARIAGNSALAVRFAKSLLNNADEMSTDAAIAFESTAQAVLFEDEDKRARMSAFLDRKKTPR